MDIKGTVLVPVCFHVLRELMKTVDYTCVCFIALHLYIKTSYCYGSFGIGFIFNHTTQRLIVVHCFRVMMHFVRVVFHFHFITRC